MSRDQETHRAARREHPLILFGGICRGVGMYILLIILEIVTATMTSSGGSSHNGTHIPEVTIE